MVNSSIKLPPSSEYGAFLTVSDMAELLKVSRFVIDRMLKTGRLPAAKLGGQYRVRTEDFFKWWENEVKQEQKKYFEGLLEVTGSPFPLYMNVTLSASHSVTFSNSAGEQNLSKKEK